MERQGPAFFTPKENRDNERMLLIALATGKKVIAYRWRSSTGVEQTKSLGVCRVNPEVIVGEPGRHAAAGSTVEKTDLD